MTHDPREALERIAFDSDVTCLAGNPLLWPSEIAYIALGGRIKDGQRVDTRESLTASAPLYTSPPPAAGWDANALDLEVPMPLSVFPETDIVAEHRITDSDGAFRFQISGSRAHAERIVSVLNAAHDVAEALRRESPAPSGVAVPELDPWRTELSEIIGHLGSAITQSVSSDDRIIMDHVKAAHEIAKIVRRKA